LRTGLAYQARPDDLSRQPRLMGRAAAWASLLETWQQALLGEARVAVLAAENGMGKTRLLQELQQWAGRQGIASPYTACRISEASLDFAPLAAWLRSRPMPLLDKGVLSEISRLLPQVLQQWPGTPAPAPLTSGWQRQKLYQALAQALQAGQQPVLLLLDDLQWCDAETLSWLQYLVDARPAHGLLVVGALDPGELPDKPPVLRFLEALQRQGRLTSIALPPLNQTQAAVLLHDLLGSQVSPAVAGHLYRRSEGNPLFLIELARASRKPSASSLPSGLQALLAGRLQRLSSSARLLAGLAAMGETPFDLETLRRACGLDEIVFLHALEEACQRRILCEAGRGYYSFTSGLLRRAAVEDLSAARRQAYQQRLAQVHPSGWQPVPPEQMAFDL
jgi:predicted ATPase